VRKNRVERLDSNCKTKRFDLKQIAGKSDFKFKRFEHNSLKIIQIIISYQQLQSSVAKLAIFGEIRLIS